MALTPSDLRRRKMNLLMAMSYAAFASSKASAWSPTLLFAAGEQGAWYDPSDFTTMFQDAAGTTPVTAVEQPVGLLLDKSKGLALGAELVTNGGLADASGWSGLTGAVSGGKLVLSSVVTNSGIFQSNASYTGGAYQVTVVIDSISSGGVSASLGVNTTVTSANATVLTTPGTHTFVTSNFGADTFLRLYSVGTSTTATIDSVSVKRISGNHASQSTAASRPVLSARVNLLTQTEAFDNAVWTESGGATATGGQLAPDGTYTAGRIVLSTGSAYGSYVLQTGLPNQPSAPMKFRSYVWCASGTQKVTIGILQSGVTAHYSGYKTITTTPTVIEHTAQFASGGSGTGLYFITGPDGVGADFFVWQPDLRVTNVGVGLPAYQRVAAATDYDANGFPLALKFDGVDDSLATGSIDFSATDKMSVFAGVRKLSDDIDRVLAELSATVNSNNGSFGIFAPSKISGPYTGKYVGALRGTALSTSELTTYAAPTTNTLSAQYDIAGASIAAESIYRVNGSTPSETTNGTQAGTGNFGNYPLYIGRRAGTSLPLNGNLYSLIVRGAQSTDAQIASTETYVNNLTKAY